MIQAASRAQLSPRVREYVYPHVLHLFFPLNKYFTLSTASRLWGNSLLQEPKGRALVTAHQLLSPQRPGLNLWLGSQASLQAEATRDQEHQRTEWGSDQLRIRGRPAQGAGLLAPSPALSPQGRSKQFTRQNGAEFSRPEQFQMVV